MSGGALYVYAIVPAPVSDDAVRGLAGIDGHPVRALACAAGVGALVHDGEPIPYQGPDDAVKRWILEHSRVVEHAWEHAGTVLPVTFNVLVRGEGEETAEERLLAWLRREAGSMREALSRLRDRQELRVEITLDRSAASAADPEVQALRAEMASKPTGLRRLLEKKAEQVERQAADRLADRLYPEYRRRIAGHAEELAEQRRSHVPPGRVPVLHAAVLARRDAVEALGADLARMQEEQPAVRIRFLGPWPPYSFAQPASTVSGVAAVREAPPVRGGK